MSYVIRADEITEGMVLLSGHGHPTSDGLKVVSIEDEVPGEPNGWYRVEAPDGYTQIYYDTEEVTVEGSRPTDAFRDKVRAIVHADDDVTDVALLAMIQNDHDVAADERGCRHCE